MLSVFIRWVVWCGRLLLVVSVAMYMCDLMYRLIKLHTHGCVGSSIRLAVRVSVGKFEAQLTLLVGVGRMDGQVKHWVWATRGLFGDEIAVFVEGMYEELFIC